AQVLDSRRGAAGTVAASAFRSVEASLLRASDAVIAISEDFLPTIERWGVGAGRVRVIENWAPVEELPLRPRDNLWARAHDLVEKRVAVYAGTLGLKHDPGLLAELAMATRESDDVRVVVVSEGPGRAWLEEQRRRLGLD